MMIQFLLLFTFKQFMGKTAQNDHSALCYGEIRKPSGFVLSIRIPWFEKWQDLMLHIFSNRTNSKQEKIRIPCLLLQCVSRSLLSGTTLVTLVFVCLSGHFQKGQRKVEVIKIPNRFCHTAWCTASDTNVRRAHSKVTYSLS